jgi:hypothetical protein
VTYNFKALPELLFFVLAFATSMVASTLLVSPDLWADPQWLLSTFVASGLRGLVGGFVALVGRMNQEVPRA